MSHSNKPNKLIQQKCYAISFKNIRNVTFCWKLVLKIQNLLYYTNTITFFKNDYFGQLLEKTAWRIDLKFGTLIKLGGSQCTKHFFVDLTKSGQIKDHFHFLRPNFWIFGQKSGFLLITWELFIRLTWIWSQKLCNHKTVLTKKKN